MQFLSNLSKIIRTQKNADLMLKMLMPFVASKSKKIRKIDKNRRSKHLYLLRDLMRDLMNFNKMFGKNITYDDIKSD